VYRLLLPTSAFTATGERGAIVTCQRRGPRQVYFDHSLGGIMFDFVRTLWLELKGEVVRDSRGCP
jgi:hypothetical protein